MKTLSNIVTVDNFEGLESNVEMLLNDMSLEFAEDTFGSYKTKEDLIINKLLLECASDKIDIEFLLNKYLIYSVKDEYNIKEVLKCIIQLTEIKSISNANIEKIYVLYKLAISKRNIELTEAAIKVSELFMDTDLENEILQDLEEIISYNNYDELISIVRTIYNKTNTQREKYKEIIKELKQKENYNLQYVFKKFFNDEKNEM